MEGFLKGKEYAEAEKVCIQQGECVLDQCKYVNLAGTRLLCCAKLYLPIGRY